MLQRNAEGSKFAIWMLLGPHDCIFVGFQGYCGRNPNPHGLHLGCSEVPQDPNLYFGAILKPLVLGRVSKLSGHIRGVLHLDITVQVLLGSTGFWVCASCVSDSFCGSISHRCF